jgi:hypothetical protein
MSKEPHEREEGKGGSFRIEKQTNTRRTVGNCDSLTGFGSLADTVECVVSCGAYISFGRTSDGGATLIRVLDGEQKLSSYCHTREELLEAMEALNKRYAPPPAKPVKFTTTPHQMTLEEKLERHHVG